MEKERSTTGGSSSPLRIDEASTLADHVYTRLHDQITSGVFLPGERLVRRVISERLGVSSMPVVEALLRLEADGLVENRAKCGARVRSLTLEEVRHDQFLREAIECHAARLCAENASAAELAALMSKAKVVDRILPRMQPESGPPEAVSKEFTKDIEFHTDIVRCGGYPTVAEELGKVWFRRMMRFSWLKLARYKPFMKNCHQKLVEAFMSRDPDRAETLMREHVRYSNENDHEAIRLLVSQEGTK